MTTHWATTEPADCEPAWDEQRRVDVVNLPDISEWNNMTDTATLDPYVTSWIDNPDGGGRFTSQRDAIRAHNPACASLAHVWLPRRGGVSCPSDLSDCDGGCGVTFYNEAFTIAFEDCPESEHWYCACCLTKATTCPCAPTEPVGNASYPSVEGERCD
jgi:hypothetical protein